MPDVDEVKYTRRSMVGGRPVGFKTAIDLLRKYAGASPEVLHELTRTGKAQQLLHT
jgi:hypothetical protein